MIDVKKILLVVLVGLSKLGTSEDGWGRIGISVCDVKMHDVGAFCLKYNALVLTTDHSS